LIFLPFALALPQFTPFTAEHHARNAVSTFTAIELGQRAPAHVFVVNITQRMHGFVDAVKFSDSLCQSSRVVAHLQGTHDASGRHSSLQERAGES
jgi:lysine/ornithine N-monooxygenase